MPKANPLKRVEAALRRAALAYPQTAEEFPWGHTAVKVKGKAFLFMSWDDDQTLGLSVKLPTSRTLVLSLPFAFRTPYGLGKSGWVSARFGPKDEVPLEMLLEWLDESFRAIAPKKVLAQLESAERDGEPPPRKAVRKKT